ncbi:HAD family hydrolase [Pseudoscardovia suis]|jgi:putative hydrolase of the HAD superfamily|uniref:HAD family hydrolase n=1 Tax=Pseudoscardovia suis TaxID=987063 RepID=UPI003F9E9C45
MKYTTVFFDLYGTLLDIHTDESSDKAWQALSDCLASHGAVWGSLDLLRRAFADEEASLELREAGKPDHEIDLAPAYHNLFALRGIEPTDEMVAEAAWTFRSASTDYNKPFDGATDLLDALRASGRRTVLLSNAQALYTLPELKKFGIAPHLDTVFISSQAGWKKPSEQFYRLALQTTGSDPEHTLMVGNDPDADIAGARRVGMDGAYLHTSDWFGDAPAAVKQFEGADYAALLDFIQNA